jgi:SpoVK/Ycf46/Vps4 family AAA+-type ATPase
MRALTYELGVIYIDECEEFFVKKSKDKEGPSRFKKDLQSYKNNALTEEHRVVIIGASKLPEKGDPKEMRNFFDKILYFPYPDYATRVLVWGHFIAKQIREGIRKPKESAAFLDASSTAKTAVEVEEAVALKVRKLIDVIDVSSLAFISEGYSVGAIVKTIRAVVTLRRVVTINQRPITGQDFIDSLSVQDYSYENDKEVYMQFGDAISDMAQKTGKKGGGKKDGDKKKKK